MSGSSPAAVLYSSDGYELATINGNSIPTNNRGLLIEGSDGTNSRFISVDTSGRVVFVGAGTAGSATGGVLTIQGTVGGTPVPISGSVSASFASVSLTASTAPTYADLAGATVSSSVLSGLTNGNMYALSMTTTGLLRVDGSNVTQPVSGSVTANAGTGNFNVIQPTASNLNATVIGAGTAGSANSGVVTIQGITGMTPIQVSQATAGNLNATVVQSTASNLRTQTSSEAANGSTAPTNATLGGGYVTSSPLSGLTSGNISALSLSTTGLLRVDGSNVTQPVSGTGTFTVAQATASNLNATVVGAGSAGTPNAGVVTVQGVSGGTRLPVITDNSANSNITSVSLSTASVALLASNTSRVSATFFNDSTSTIMYIALAATATTSAYTIKLLAGDYWELPISYTGAISAISNTASGSCRITELY